jgi:hypothetical protein
MTEGQNVIQLQGKALADKVIGQLEAFPQAQYQDLIWCGTTACIAGWCMAMSEGHPIGTIFGPDLIAEMFNRADQDIPGYTADLLGVDVTELSEKVFNEMDEVTALENFKLLTKELVDA